MALCCCSTRCFLIFILLSAIPFAFIIHLETSSTKSSYQYHSTGWLRECTKWDGSNSQFIMSFMEGGFGVVPVPEKYQPGMVLEETPMVKNSVDLGKNSTLGFVVDRDRNRVVAAIGDVIGNRFSAVAAYDLTTWDRVFLTKLSGPEDGKTMADDVAVDPEGNAYITDVTNSKIWKVSPEGVFLYTITSPLFTPNEWYNNLVGLNGIVYHPNGYLLVIHTFSGRLFKIDITKGDEVKLVYLGEDSLKFGDGIDLLSPTKLVVAGNPSRLVESVDDWESGNVVGKFRGAAHRLVTAATVKDGKAYLNHLFGLGYPKKKHVLVQAPFA